MANGAYPGPLHPVVTDRHSYQYFFYNKHHNGPLAEAQWLLPPQLTQNEEFEVFNRADALELSDGHGNLYGLRPRAAGAAVATLGTRGEQFAKFPVAHAGQAWHGFPIWPIAKPRDDEDLRPIPNEVLGKMVEKEVIDVRERKRVRKGDHI